MSYPILGLHHVTATVDRAQPDLDFCAGTLGLRLVKKTVNFDNHHVYHFYYGDERGTPGTIWTTFPYHGRNVRVGTQGAGQVTATSFSVPSGSLDYWEARFRERDAAIHEMAGQFDDETIRVADPSGLVIELVTGGGDDRQGWTGSGIDPAAAVRGLHSVSLTVQAAAPTIRFFSDVLGCRTVAEQEGRTRLAVASGGPGTWLDIVEAPGAPAAVNGLGTVHHVALAIASDDDQLRLREELLARGANVTEVRDRQYFRSIYFREPGGVLIEVATVRPGFDVDEPLPCLGQDLKLPPWEEPHRAEIEAGLPEIRVPEEGRRAKG